MAVFPRHKKALPARLKYTDDKMRKYIVKEKGEENQYKRQSTAGGVAPLLLLLFPSSSRRGLESFTVSSRTVADTMDGT